MNDLNAISSIFTSEEQQRFVLYLEKKNKRRDTKNILLFKLIVSKNISSKDICAKIYGHKKANAYHALRKRLYQSIIDFIANTSLQEENSTDMHIIKYILASRKCLMHKEYKVAFKILKKAELLATEHHLFSLLNEVYHTKIQYAHLNQNVSLDAIISSYKTNQRNLLIEDELNIVYAKVRQALKKYIYLDEMADFESILSNILKSHHPNLNKSLSFKSLYQLMSIVNFSAFVNSNYLKTEPFLLNTYNSILNHGNKEKSVYYHIQILYLIANTLFRNKKFEVSQKYLIAMHAEMLCLRKKYYTQFKPKYNLLLALNLNYTNKQDDSIDILKSTLLLKQIDIETIHDIQLSLIMSHFQQGQHKKAYSLLSKLHHTDKWYIEKIGKDWTIKKNLIEILLLIELRQIDLVESRLLSFKRGFYKYLQSINQDRVIIYLNFVESYYKHPENVTSEKFKNKVETSFTWIETYKEDIFVMSFYSWLKGKMNKTDLYRTTMQLINQAKQGLKA